MKRWTWIIAIFFVLPLCLPGETAHVPSGSKIYIAPMRGGLNRFLVTQIAKQKLPVAVVVDQREADYLLTGSPSHREDRWYNTVLGGKDQTEWNIQLVRLKDSTVAWAGSAGDRAMWFADFGDHQQKAASRIVRQMKRDLFLK